MININLPVKWLREKGVELELDDIWLNPRIFGPTKISKSTLVSFNDGELNYLSITSFAWRVSNPMIGLSVVPIELMDCPSQAVAKWKPDAKALMEMYTAEQSAKLTETKKETKLKLTKDDVGKEFLCNGHIAKVCNISGGAERFVLSTSTDGFIIVNKNGKSCTSDSFQLEQHEPRHWLKDLPDADSFILFGTKWLTFAGIHWCAHQKEPFLKKNNFQYDGHTDILLDIELMPKLKSSEWKLSKISIDDLREWQKENK